MYCVKRQRLKTTDPLSTGATQLISENLRARGAPCQTFSVPPHTSGQTMSVHDYHTVDIPTAALYHCTQSHIHTMLHPCVPRNADVGKTKRIHIYFSAVC